MPNNSETMLSALEYLVGTWVTEATHPALPGVVVRGTVDVEWLEGKRFLIHRARNDHADFPDSISLMGFTEQDRVDRSRGTSTVLSDDSALTMHYYDSRGVYRSYELSITAEEWRIWRDAPGFSQRFTGKLADGGSSVAGKWQTSEDGTRWNDDLEITYRRK